MEQNKVVVVVIVAVVVVFGIVGMAWWQFYPKQDRAPVVQFTQPANNQAAVTASPAASPSAMVADPSASAAPLMTQSQEVVIVYGNNPAYTQDAGKSIAIGPPVQSPLPVASAAPVLPSAKPVTASKAPAVKASVAPKVVQAEKKPVRVTELWIQVLSSPNRDRVDSVRKELSAKGWSGRVTVKNVDKVDYYRLRFGPFVDKKEAEKFLAWVREVPGLKESFLVEEYPLR